MPRRKHTGTRRATVRESIDLDAISPSQFGIFHGLPAKPTHITAADTTTAMKASRMAQSAAPRRSYAPWIKSSSSQKT
jgi:hypothetical protein